MHLQTFQEQPGIFAPEYAALSYIWGESEQFQTSKDNISSRVKSIDIESLPQTVKDAVLTCRILQFQYLWVDALCIIQDDPYDKAKQISMMGDIYRGAAVTLVAATSPNSKSGFWSDTFNNTISPFLRCRYKTSKGEESSVYLIKKPSEQDRFPIENRGWTMQERLLSSRLLFFHTGRIDWVCHVDHLFAGCSSSYSVNLINGTLTRDNKAWDEFDVFSPTNVEHSLEAQIRQWYNLCTTFSQRQLSDPMDCLPAISGMAKEFQTLFPGVALYIAGMWTTDLPRQMLWRASPLRELAHKHDSYIAPSWSWASTRQAFHWPTFAVAEAAIRLEILDIDDQPAPGHDCFGQLASAHMKVKGRLKSARWNISKQTIESADGLSALGNPRTDPDSLAHAATGPLAGTSLVVHCLEIQDARFWVRRFKTSLGQVCTGLLLLPSQAEPASTFERVGLFSLARVGEHETDYAVIAAAVKNLAWFEDAPVREITLV